MEVERSARSRVIDTRCREEALLQSMADFLHLSPNPANNALTHAVTTKTWGTSFISERFFCLMLDDIDLAARYRRARPTLLFLAKAVAIYGVWYVLYDLWLLPDGRLDAWISRSVVHVGAFGLDLVGFDAMTNARTLTLPGTAGIRVVDGCNGIGSIGLFVGFVVAFPGRAWRRAWFVPLGILVIYLSNVGRVTGLLLLQNYWDAGFGAAHSVGAPMFFYTVIFGLWVLWVNYGGNTESAVSASDEQPRPAPA